MQTRSGSVCKMTAARACRVHFIPSKDSASHSGTDFQILKKSCTSCPNWGERRGGEVIWTKSKRNTFFFSGCLPSMTRWFMYLSPNSWRRKWTSQSVLFLFWLSTNLNMININFTVKYSDCVFAFGSGRKGPILEYRKQWFFSIFSLILEFLCFALIISIRPRLDLAL